MHPLLLQAWLNVKGTNPVLDMCSALKKVTVQYMDGTDMPFLRRLGVLPNLSCLEVGELTCYPTGKWALELQDDLDKQWEELRAAELRVLQEGLNVLPPTTYIIHKLLVCPHPSLGPAYGLSANCLRAAFAAV